MTRKESGTLVLRGEDGAYYALTPDLLERARLPEEQRAELEARLGSTDTSGFAFTLLTTLPTSSGSVWGVSSGTETNQRGPGHLPRLS